MAMNATSTKATQSAFCPVFVHLLGTFGLPCGCQLLRALLFTWGICDYITT